MPVMEHPFGGSWGYQVTSYFAADRPLRRPRRAAATSIDRLHQAGIGVILDWVPGALRRPTSWRWPASTARRSTRTPTPSAAEHPEWGTHVFNFGRKEVRNFLVANALYWLEEFHADGLRVDAVASMLYLDYSREAGRVDARTCTAAARTSRRWRSCRR